MAQVTLRVDINTYEIIAVELSVSSLISGEVQPNLLQQPFSKINEILTNGAYDTR
ncbi:hypothetical protein [Candidatus Enterovibrio altilux]|uniref:hypothetical protein n=1 Tax=Candidatus Enterovibrio altilux TaxID=1927128 RepID=UPI0037434095